MSKEKMKGCFHSDLEGDVNKHDSEELQYLAALTAQVEMSSPLAARRAIKQAYLASVNKATATSPMTECFMVSADDRVEITKMSLDGANILKAYGLTFVPVDGVASLHYQLVEKYHGSVSLKDMLKSNSFKDKYNACK